MKKKAGNIRYFGCSNWSAARILEAQDYAKTKGIQGFSGNQVMWSLAQADRLQIADPTLIPMDEDMKGLHVNKNLAAFPYSPQAQGMFTKWDVGFYSKDDERINPAYRTEENGERFKRAQQLELDLSLTMIKLYLAILFHSHSQPVLLLDVVRLIN
jgi:aryl-alcohol dehydrogenase-like predicted oxidoreductase